MYKHSIFDIFKPKNMKKIRHILLLLLLICTVMSMYGQTWKSQWKKDFNGLPYESL